MLQEKHPNILWIISNDEKAFYVTILHLKGTKSKFLWNRYTRSFLSETYFLIKYKTVVQFDIERCVKHICQYLTWTLMKREIFLLEVHFCNFRMRGEVANYLIHFLVSLKTFSWNL